MERTIHLGPLPMDAAKRGFSARSPGVAAPRFWVFGLGVVGLMVMQIPWGVVSTGTSCNFPEKYVGDNF